MLNTRMNPNSKSLFRLTSRLLCLLVLLAVAGWVNTTSKAANRFSCVMSVDSDGYPTILSCGSSAGNFLYTCFGSAGCVIDTDPISQVAADLSCADFAQYGCPSDGGNGGIGGILP